MFLKTIFWVLLGIIFYTYFFYTIILVIIKIGKDLISKSVPVQNDFQPEVSLFIAAFNEKDYIEQKLKNSRELDYPSEKIKMVWVTDGSDDGSDEILTGYSYVNIYHQPERKGKINAMNRGMKMVSAPIVIFSDANTDLTKNSIKEIVRYFSDEKVGCVAGEKRIYLNEKEKAVGAGEGLYWKYESLIKSLESGINSTVGAAGELFAIRSELYEDVEQDTILDDFVISLRIALKGYRVKYAPKASASEKASYSINEELKRKIRIATGSFQVLFRLTGLLNIFKHGLLSFQYISHKVLRWLFVPVSFLLLFIINLIIVINTFPEISFFSVSLSVQFIFYLLVLFGWLIRNRKIRFKFLFVPYYLFVMNYSILAGMFRYFSGKQSAVWEKVRRS